MRRTVVVLWLLGFSGLARIGGVSALEAGGNMSEERPNHLRNVLFLPGRDLIVGACAAGPQGTLRFWSVRSGTLENVMELGDHVWAEAMAVSGDGTLLAVSMLPHTVGCFSLTEKRWLWKVDAREDAIVGDSMVFSSDGKKLTVVSFKTIVAYDATTGGVLQKQNDSRGFSAGFPEYRTRFSVVSPSGRHAAFFQGNLEHDEGPWYSKNIWVVVWDLEKGTPALNKASIQAKYKNCSAAFTPDERTLLLGSMDGKIRVMSIAEQKVIDQWSVSGSADLGRFSEEPAPYTVQAMAFSPDGQYLASMARWGMGVWTWPAHERVREFPNVFSGGGNAIGFGYPVAFSGDSTMLAFENQGRLCLYDVGTWAQRWCVPSWK